MRGVINRLNRKPLMPPADFKELAVRRREEPSFNVFRPLELVTFAGPNVKRLLGKVRRIRLAPGKAEAKPIKISVITFHQLFKIYVGGHVAVIP